jgi:hypothetical protein
VEPGEVLVFDTSPLCHFAQQNWLGLLKAVVGERVAVIPDVVSDELRVGAGRDSRLDAVPAATWIEHANCGRPRKSPRSRGSLNCSWPRTVTGVKLPYSPWPPPRAEWP